MGPSLGTLTLGTYTNFSSTTKTGADPVLESIAAFNDGTYVSDATNSSHTGTAQFTLADMPADFKHIETLTLQVRYLASGAQTNTWQNITARVYKADGVSFLTDAATIVEGPITNTAGANSLIVTFPNPDLTATAADWNGAKVWLSWFVIRNKGGDTVQKRITAAQLTGTYAIDTSIEKSEDVTVDDSFVAVKLSRLVLDTPGDTVTVTDGRTVVITAVAMQVFATELVIVNEGQETVPKINVFDPVTVEEAWGIGAKLSMAVFDPVLAEDSPAVQPVEITVPLSVVAFDVVFVREGQSDINGPQLNVFDPVLADDTFATIDMNLRRMNVFDDVFVTDFGAIPQTKVLISGVFDPVLVQEARFATVTLKINCMDEVYVIDGAPVMFEFDAVFVTDVPTVSIARLTISAAFDQVILLPDTATVLLPFLCPSGFDLVTLTDDGPITLVSNTIPLPVVFDQAIPVDASTVLLTKLNITAFDDVLVDEPRTGLTLTRLTITAFDPVTVQEDAAPLMPYLSVTSGDDVMVVDDGFAILAFLLIDQFDEFFVTDGFAISPLTVNIPNPAETEVFDELVLEDGPTVSLSRIVPEVFDPVTVLDDCTIIMESIDLVIDAFDDVAVTDDFTLVPNPLNLDEFTQVIIDDAGTVNLPFLAIGVSDEVTALDAVNGALSFLLISVFDEVHLDERVAMRITRPGQSRRHQLPVIGVE